jgi:PBP1b-binding outer membrane lipoprotein LpoB
MSLRSLLFLLAFSLLMGCGGIKHIPDVRSETQWHNVARADSRTTAPKEAAQPPPTEVPFRRIDVRGAYVAVFDIQDKSKTLSRMELESLTDYLATKMAEDGLFHVVPREEIQKRLLSTKQKSYKSCYDQSCQIEIGREIAAQKTLSVKIASIGSSCIVTAALYDLKKAATNATATTRGKCDTDALLAQIEEIITKFRRMAK